MEGDLRGGSGLRLFADAFRFGGLVVALVFVGQEGLELFALDDFLLQKGLGEPLKDVAVPDDDLACVGGRGGEAALENWRYLLTPRSTCRKDTHIHPFLSPDGTMGFFNSDESGLLQAYMVRGL